MQYLDESALIQLRDTLNNNVEERNILELQPDLEDIVIPDSPPGSPPRHEYPLKRMVTLSIDTANIEEVMLFGIEPTECPICYDNECDVTTGCGHGFCRVCVETQFIASIYTPTHPSCALCRQEMCELSSTSGRTLACLEEFLESENISARMLY
jgi:hypothetical protein